MFKVGEYLVYRKSVCQVKDIKEKDGNKYYQLVPIDDDSLKIEIPVDNPDNVLRALISREELDSLINKMPTIELIECNDKMIELEYRNLLSTGNKEDIIKVIKTAYLRNKARIENKKKISEKDNNYLEKAEKLLYNEFSVVLNLSFDDTRQYIINKVEAM